MEAGEQASSRRRADRRAGIGLSETYAIAGEEVDVGRGKFLLAVTTKVSVAEIVGDNQDNVGMSLVVRVLLSGNGQGSGDNPGGQSGE